MFKVELRNENVDKVKTVLEFFGLNILTWYLVVHIGRNVHKIAETGRKLAANLLFTHGHA